MMRQRESFLRFQYNLQVCHPEEGACQNRRKRADLVGIEQYSTNKKEAHSWFVGYAENSEGKKLAVAVIMEGAGYGSKYAAPLAAKVFNSYLE